MRPGPQVLHPPFTWFYGSSQAAALTIKRHTKYSVHRKTGHPSPVRRDTDGGVQARSTSILGHLGQRSTLCLQGPRSVPRGSTFPAWESGKQRSQRQWQDLSLGWPQSVSFHAPEPGIWGLPVRPSARQMKGQLHCGAVLILSPSQQPQDVWRRAETQR
jgi:hypothetical protein